jgi:hypothetical protein
MVCHYSRRKDLATELEQGIAIYNDAQNIFEVSKSLPLSEKWRRPSGHPITYEENGKKWLLFGSPTPNVRVPATLLDVQNAASYEAFTCLTTSNNPETPQLDEQGNPRWRWQKELPPIDAKQAFAWVKSGKFKPEQVHYSPVNLRNLSEPIQLHNGSVRWNSLRQRWILLAGQLGGSSSHLGEIWYAEADQPTGPFTHAVKVVTHERQSCYNVCHHDFLDRKQGRFIHFEGTYTNDFSGNPERTPRYHYNQVLFRLDLKTINLE